MAKEWIVPDADLGCDGAYFDYQELVRCRECIHNRKGEHLDVDCEKDHDFTRWLSPDFYCADGERKDKLEG